MAKSGLCAVDGCGKLSINWRGWCSAHYQRWQRHGSPIGGGPAKPPNGTLVAWVLDHQNSDTDECLLWPFSRAPNGYPNVMEFEGAKLHAHRLMCRLVYGEPPTPVHQAAHSCGRGREGCMTPRHLRWATPLENTQEKWAHGTMALGQRCGSELSEQEVLAIWSRRPAGGQRTVAAEFGVTRDIVRRIWLGLNWSWLTGAPSDRVDTRRQSRRMG